MVGETEISGQPEILAGRIIKEYDGVIKLRVYLKLLVVEMRESEPEVIKEKLDKKWDSIKVKFADEIIRKKEELSVGQLRSEKELDDFIYQEYIGVYKSKDNNKINDLKKRSDSYQSLIYIVGVKNFIEMILKKYPTPHLAGFLYFRWPAKKWPGYRIWQYIRCYFGIRKNDFEKNRVERYIKDNELFEEIKQEYSEEWRCQQYFNQMKKKCFVFMPLFEYTYKEDVYKDRKRERQHEKMLFWTYYLVEDGKVKKFDSWHTKSYNQAKQSVWGLLFQYYDKWIKSDKKEKDDKKRVKKDDKKDVKKHVNLRPVLIIDNRGKFSEIKSPFYRNFPNWNFEERKSYLGKSLWLVDDFIETAKIIDEIAKKLKKDKSISEKIREKYSKEIEKIGDMMVKMDELYYECSSYTLDEVKDQKELRNRIAPYEANIIGVVRKNLSEKRN